MANSSASTIEGYIWTLARTNGSTTDLQALQDAFLLRMISEANMEYLRAHRKSGGAQPIVTQREAGFDLVPNTAVNDEDGVLTSDVSITVDSHTFPDEAGVLAVWSNNMPDKIPYTGSTSTSFTGVSDVSFSHDDNDPIQPLYKLPDNFKTFRPADDFGDGCRLNGQPLRFVQGVPDGGQFSMHDDGTNKYLWLPYGASSGRALVWYDKKAATIDDAEDTIDAPVEDEMFVVWRALDLALFAKRDSQLRAEAKVEWMKKLKDILDDRNIGRHVRARPIRPLRPGYYDPSLYIQQ